MNAREAGRMGLFAALKAHRRFNIDTTRWVDVFACIHAADLVLGFQKLPKLAGMYLAELQPGILINSNHPLSRQRYTAAHELAHYLNHDESTVDTEVDLFDGNVPQKTDAEMIADAFASWFLMPEALVMASLTRLGLARPTNAMHVYQLALQMGTSFTATAWHMYNLKMTSFATASAWCKTPPADLKRALLNTSEIDNSWSDVFLINDCADGDALLVKAQDRLVFQLPEIPSTGYRWQIAPSETISLLRDDYLRDDSATSVSGIAVATTSSAATRRFVLAVGTPVGLDALKESIHLVCSPAWEPSEVSSQISINVCIEQPRHGVSHHYFEKAA